MGYISDSYLQHTTLCSKEHEGAIVLTLLPLGPCGPDGPRAPEGPYVSKKLIIHCLLNTDS